MCPGGVTEASVSSKAYETRTGRGHVVLPASFNSSSCGLVNIRKNDDMGFKFCIAAAINPPKNNPSPVYYYISKNNQGNLYCAFD
jgi:5,10-methylenetetrahydrofolate reductase